MKKYCSNCGKELKNGKACICKSKNNPLSFMDSICTLTKKMFIKPIDTMKDYINENNWNHALIILGINAVTFAILFCIFIKKTAYPLLTVFQSNIKHSLFEYTPKIEIPYFKIILIIIPIILIFYTLLTFIIYIIDNKVFKNKTSYKKMFVWLAPSISVMTFFYLLCIVCLCLSISLAIWIYIVGSLLCLCYLYNSLHYVCDIKENQLGYIFITSITFSSFIIIHLLPNIFSVLL